MSSTYPPNDGIPRCRRCGVPLTPSDPRCHNCGYDNANASTGYAPPSIMSWNQSAFPVPQSQPPFPGTSEQGQFRGLLRKPSLQEGGYTQPSQSRQQQAQQPPFVQQPSVPQLSFDMPLRMPQQPAMNYTSPLAPTASQEKVYGLSDQSNQIYKQSGQSGQLSNFDHTYRSGFSQQAGFSFSPEAAFSSRSLPPDESKSFAAGEKQKRRPNKSLLAGVVLLVAALIGGSIFGYILLSSRTNNHNSVAQSTSAATFGATSASKGNPLFADNFMDNSKNWSIQSYAGEFSVAIGNGALTLENDNNRLLWELVPDDKNYSDFQLSVDAVLSKGTQDNGYGVYIRGTVSQNGTLTTYYRFELYGDGSYAIFKGTMDTNGNLASSRLVDYTNTSAIHKQGNLNHIMINAKGSALQLIVNGQILTTVSDTNYTNGTIALFVSNLQKAPPRAQAMFSHFAIYPVQR